MLEKVHTRTNGFSGRKGGKENHTVDEQLVQRLASTKGYDFSIGHEEAIPKSSSGLVPLY